MSTEFRKGVEEGGGGRGRSHMKASSADTSKWTNPSDYFPLPPLIHQVSLISHLGIFGKGGKRRKIEK